MSQAPINVVFASDENFLKYTATTLVSILKNMKTDRNLSVFVMTDAEISREGLEGISKLFRIRNFKFTNLIVDASQFAKIKTTPGISLATYYRLVMHDLLPADVDRVLYLDSDIIVRKCISEIYDTDLTGYLFAGVQDSISKRYNDKFGAPLEAPHINAGVTLVNVRAVRDANFSDRINRYLDSHKYLITLGDQQIINGAFQREIKYIPATWNVHGSMFDRQWRSKNVGINNTFTKAEIDAAVEDPAVIHYTFKRKPWMSSEHPRTKEWFAYAQLTPFFEATSLGSIQSVAKASAPSTAPKPSAKKKAFGFSTHRFLGYLKSIQELRTTRLTVNKLLGDVDSLGNRPVPQSLTPYYLIEEQSARLLGEIGAMQSGKSFDAETYVKNLPEYQHFYTNGEPKDLDGGFHENLKTILKTPDIRRDLDLSETDAVVMMVQRLRQDLFWKALYAARYYGRDIVFAETTFFGAFATYFDKGAPSLFRRSFGYILDDMGYYFDARNPSRLEMFLNSDAAQLPRQEEMRARRLIDRIVAEGITKYNYSSSPSHPMVLPQGSVLVVDQKQGDASIEFAAATSRTFDLMIDAAIRENPEASVYLKPHPDNMGKKPKSIHPRVKMVPEDVSVVSVLDQCEKVYVVSSQVGFEALLRGKEVHVFGLPFYSGWGLTKDRQKLPRRTYRRTVEELFHAACIRHSVYINSDIGKIVPIEDAFDWMLSKLVDLRIAA